MNRKEQPADASETLLRQEICEVGQMLAASGLSPGASGNLSVRRGKGLLISPSGGVLGAMAPEEIVAIDGAGNSKGLRSPSSEWHFHRSALRRRPDCSAVVHLHSPHATILACRREPIPAFHYMVAVAGGVDIPCVPYATFGTEELAEHVADGLTSRQACLMANHGLVAIGTSLRAAAELAAEVEELARQYCGVLALGGPKLLSDEEMARVLARFERYRQGS